MYFVQIDLVKRQNESIPDFFHCNKSVVRPLPILQLMFLPIAETRIFFVIGKFIHDLIGPARACSLKVCTCQLLIHSRTTSTSSHLIPSRESSSIRIVKDRRKTTCIMRAKSTHARLAAPMNGFAYVKWIISAPSMISTSNPRQWLMV